MLLFLAFAAAGCATRCTLPANSRPFVYGQDTFAYRNELVWNYEFDDEAAKVRRSRAEQKSHYTLRCFAMTRSVRQFYQYAEFAPSLPVADDATYRQLVRRVLARDPMHCRETTQRVVIPGYTNLFHFSSHKTQLLKKEAGKLRHSYFQRGHWRMVFPFTKRHQEKEARLLAMQVRANRPPVVHLVRFPGLSINHAMLLYDVKELADGLEFTAYDPNYTHEPVALTFLWRKREFSLPRLDDFAGGPVDVYQVYRSWNY